MRARCGWALLGLVGWSACAARPPEEPPAAPPAPPVAERIPHTVRSPHGDRDDPWYWLRDDTRSDPRVLAHLAAENAYFAAMTAHLRDDVDALYAEMAARVAPEDVSAPERKHGWWTFERTVAGGEYPIYARRRAAPDGRYDPDAPEEVLLDGNALAKDHGFFEIGQWEVTRDGRTLAWLEDTVGRGEWRLRFRRLDTGEVLPESLTRVEDALAWANDGRTILYVEKDPVTLLGTRVRKHVLGSDPRRDEVVYEEKDPAWFIGLAKSRSGRFLVITLSSTLATEQWVADADDPHLRFRVLLPRERGHEYQAEDHGDEWILRTNWRAKNFRVVRAPMAQVADRSRWRDVVPHPPAGFVHEALVFRDHLVAVVREAGRSRLRLVRWRDHAAAEIAFEEPAYAVWLADNPEPDAGALRFVYSSATTPESSFDHDFATGARTLVKREPLPGSFDPAAYVTEYVFAPARDGARVPVSIVHRRGVRRDGTAPLVLQGYGAYGDARDLEFGARRLSLLDRGVVFAFAHVRGGGELGRDWYEGGKLLAKKNTFTDFLDVTDFLVREGYAAPDRVAAIGRSAGGLLIGAVANLAPEKYRAIVAHVPFVDVVTTMLDLSIPLTSNELDEWGDPRQKALYDYLLSYSPYDNVARRDYPAMLVTTGLWDPAVQYYEPAKWVARLRAAKTDANPLLFEIDLQAGHQGQAGRFQELRETAKEYAFVLEQLGVPVAVDPTAPRSTSRRRLDPEGGPP
jgi:oligopeptidase B